MGRAAVPALGQEATAGGSSLWCLSRPRHKGVSSEASSPLSCPVLSPTLESLCALGEENTACPFLLSPILSTFHPGGHGSHRARFPFLFFAEMCLLFLI